jgi:hypothetical protein
MRVSHYKEGEYVHVPSGVVAYKLDGAGSVAKYIGFDEPLALMYLGKEEDPKFPGDSLCKVFYGGDVWMVLEENIYEMRGKDE